MLAFVASVPPLSTNAQGTVTALVAAADPFEKFVHDVLGFGRFVIQRSDQIKLQNRADSVPLLSQAMHDVAARKRDFADSIREPIVGSTEHHHEASLNDQVDDLNKAIDNLVSRINEIDPAWAGRHNETEKDISKIKFEKVGIESDVLYYASNKGEGKLNKTEALGLAARLDRLADELDSVADQINRAFARS
jgi:hypothetical protein